ncbi:MAG: hypothetical protein ACXADU_19080 [Promethearchaeota archaeon]|jgi:hypothetical protein
MSRKKYTLIKESRSPKTLMYTYFGILLFITIFFPFFELNFRYQLGRFFSKIFEVIGTVTFTIGGAITAVRVISLFFGFRMRARLFLVGVVLLWIGCWTTGTMVKLFGMPIGNAQTGTGSGYH